MTNDTQPKFNGLDHLRSLAIMMVFLFHYFILSHGEPKWLPDVAKFGWTGVDLFFVLSGFLISSQLFAQLKQTLTINLKTFFIKRFCRIIPPFLFTVSLYFLFPFFREKESLPPLWKFLTFTQNLGLNIKDFGTFSHAWSLCVEEHFYLLLPFILAVLVSIKFFKKAYWLIIILFLFGIAIRAYSFYKLYLPVSENEYGWMYWYKFIYYPTYTRLDGLLVGVSIAGIYQFIPTLWHKLSAYASLLFVSGLMLLTAAYFVCFDQSTSNASIWGFPIVAIGYGFLVTAAISPTSFLNKWKSSGTQLIATLSYGMYLTHKGVIHMTHVLLERFELNNNLLLIISLVASLVFAYALHLVIEKPSLKLRKWILTYTS